MKIVIALGGNALLKRGQPMTYENQHANIVEAAQRICSLLPEHELVITHGNGPQVGLLALQAAAYTKVAPYPLDVLGAQTEAMIGYTIEQEIRNHADPGRHVATMLTLVRVDASDPAFADPTKPIGPVYDEAAAEALKVERGWAIAPDGDAFRRVVPSPRPQEILEIDEIRALAERACIVICAGGGGIPTIVREDGRLEGVEAVIDKDLCAAKLAEGLGADLLVIATDVDGLFLDWGTDRQRMVLEAAPEDLEGLDLPKGSMGPKVEGACDFVRATGMRAAIGSLSDIDRIVVGEAGTSVVSGASLRTAEPVG